MQTRIKELCQAQGLTVVELAKRLNMAQPNMSNIANGKTSPSIEKLQEIASALGVELWQLFTPTTARPNFSAHIHIEEPQVRDFCVYSYEDFKTVAATLEQIMNPENK